LFDPEEVLWLGILNRMVAADQLEAAVADEAARRMTLDGSSFTATKARVNEAVIAAVSRAIDVELAIASR